MIIRREFLLAAVLTALLAGCGSNFEWFPKTTPFTNHSTVAVTAPGTVMREIPFPTLPFPVKAVSDIAYDKKSASFWMLAVFNGNSSNAPDALVRMPKNSVDGTYAERKDANAWPVSIGKQSTLAYDGSTFWITSSGASGGVITKEIYQILSSGIYLDNGSFKYLCPVVTDSSGFCQGLAWDTTTSSFWSAASDSANLVNFKAVSGTVTSAKPYPNLWLGSGVSDVSYDSATGEVFVIKNGIIRVKGSNGAALGTIPFTVPGNGRGDWDGQYFWVIDNNAKKIKALFIR